MDAVQQSRVCRLGTRFLATEECQVPDDCKQAIVAHDEDDIVWTNKLAGVFPQ